MVFQSQRNQYNMSGSQLSKIYNIPEPGITAFVQAKEAYA